MVYPITAGDVLEAIREGAREGTAQAMKDMFETGSAKVQLTGTVDMATETTLAQSVDRLNSILSRLEGKLDTAIFDSQGNPISTNNRLPVDVGGQIEADVNLGDVTVDLGVVKQGGKDASAEPWEVQLTGRLAAGGEGAGSIRAGGEIAASTSVTLIEWPAGVSVEIISLELSSNIASAGYLVMEARSPDGSLQPFYRVIVPDGGSGTSGVSVGAVANDGSGMFEVYANDGTNNKMGLRPGIRIWWPNGGRIQRRNNSPTEAANVAVSVCWREVQS